MWIWRIDQVVLVLLGGVEMGKTVTNIFTIGKLILVGLMIGGGLLLFECLGRQTSPSMPWGPLLPNGISPIITMPSRTSLFPAVSWTRRFIWQPLVYGSRWFVAAIRLP